MKKISFAIHLFLNCLHCVTITALSTYYCKPNKENVAINGVDSGYIYTKFNNTDFYSNNLECYWTIDAGSDSKAVRLKILDIDLQYTPDYSICATYDFVQVLITDRYSGDQNEVVSFCGQRNPDAVISNSRYMKIKFQSNQVNFYDKAGVKMYFTTFEWSSGCPPGWSEPTPDSDYCYILKTKPVVPWELAQYHCNYEGSNLASVVTLNEYKYINDLVNQSVSEAWIGLNDITAEDSVHWLEGEGVRDDLEGFVEETNNDEGNDCYIEDFETGKFVESHCINNKYGFLCKKRKGKKTPIYDIPIAGRRKDEDADDGINLIIGVVCGVVGLLVIVGIIAACVICCRRGQRFSANDSESPSNERYSAQISQREEPPPYHQAVSLKEF